jgi:hypothetical protein
MTAPRLAVPPKPASRGDSSAETEMPTWDDVLLLDGFSSEKNRTLLNQAVATVPHARILEVGSYLGSTAVAMCHDNSVECIHLIDNHSEFGDTRQRLAETAERFGLPATIHGLDYLAPLPPGLFGSTTFNVYFYDGSHDEEHHARELSVAWPHLANTFLYIVDDYSWQHVRRGCDAGMEALSDRLTVVSKNVYESRTTNDREGYWNGLLIAWCVKNG